VLFFSVNLLIIIAIFIFFKYFLSGENLGGGKITKSSTNWLALHPTLAGHHQLSHHAEEQI